MKRSLLTLLLVSTLGISACHSMRFEVTEDMPTDTVTERKNFFLVGLAPTVEVDVSTKCPNGVVAIEEETTFVDGLFNLLTLSIWTPRTTTYHCARRSS